MDTRKDATRRCQNEQHEWTSNFQGRYCTKCGVLYDPKLEQLGRTKRAKARKVSELRVLRAALESLFELRDYHDDTCDHSTACADSVKADKAAKELELLIKRLSA